MRGLILLSALFYTALNTVVVSAQDGVITLESQVKGNQEQPNVLSIVPWKEANDRSRIDRGVEADISRLFQHLDKAELARQQHFYQHFAAELQQSEVAATDTQIAPESTQTNSQF